jgi:S1-C subfamily serine protease
MRASMKTFALTMALALIPCAGAAQRAKSPADATVFIRLTGSVHAEFDDAGIKRTVDLDRVEVGTGSGFVISPYGYVLTNAHVVENGEPLRLAKGFQKATITLKVSSINVCFSAEAMSARGMTSPCAEASVTASDQALDLAVLFIGGSSGLPYIALGDSDVIAPGLAVDALGYPFGRDVEIGRVATAPDLVPDISTTPGAISALRANDAGERRYLQVTNSLNPGNSGGPLVTRDGFAVGVIHSRLTKGKEIGFAIPINEVKNLLDSHGLDHVMPTRRLRLGVFQTIDPKGVALRLPEGFIDRSPFMSHLETEAAAGEVGFRLDRVLSPWTPKRVEEALVSSQAFEPMSMAPRPGRDQARPPVPDMLLGGAAGTSGDGGREVRMDYAVLDLGPEKLVGRFVGPAEPMAFNESVLRDSLLTLQGERFIASELRPADTLNWSTMTDAGGRGVLPVPAGWVLEPGRPAPCRGLPAPSMVASAFPARDATVVLRAAVWPPDVVPETAAQACSSRRGSLGPASYATSTSWLGVSYVIEGAFTRTGASQVVQLEVLATEQQSAFARTLLGIWLKKTTE